jgi:hypothetical protein
MLRFLPAQSRSRYTSRAIGDLRQSSAHPPKAICLRIAPRGRAMQWKIAQKIRAMAAMIPSRIATAITKQGKISSLLGNTLTALRRIFGRGIPSKFNFTLQVCICWCSLILVFETLLPRSAHSFLNEHCVVALPYCAGAGVLMGTATVPIRNAGLDLNENIWRDLAQIILRCNSSRVQLIGKASSGSRGRP